MKPLQEKEKEVERMYNFWTKMYFASIGIAIGAFSIEALIVINVCEPMINAIIIGISGILVALISIIKFYRL